MRPEVELLVNASDIPSVLQVDLYKFELGDTINISDIDLPSGSETTIQGRDFVIANIQSPSGLKSTENEEEVGEEAADDNTQDTKSEDSAQN